MTVFNFKTKKVGQNLSAPNSNDSIVGGTGNDSLLGSGDRKSTRLNSSH